MPRRRTALGYRTYIGRRGWIVTLQRVGRDARSGAARQPFEDRRLVPYGHAGEATVRGG